MHPLVEEQRSAYLCDCGHLWADHKFDGVAAEPCVNFCGCQNFHWSLQILKDCGHLPDDDPCERLPVVRAKRGEDDRWIVDCPYCGHEHRHSTEEGDRVAHCHQGDYLITAPIPERRKLPFRKVWDRDDWRCVTCGTHKNLTVDHILPVSKGGTDDLDNLQTMCGSCNSRKGNRI